MLQNFSDYIESLVLSMGSYAPIAACLFILIESIIPILPLFVFITINFIAFGPIFGFIISWIFTCLGCFLSFYLVRKNIRSWNQTRLNQANLFYKCLNYINNLSLTSITVILAIPFTPAFMMNIAAGLSNMKFKKFAIAILISKVFLVYFWGYVGVSLIESFKNPIALIKIAIMVVLAYLLSLCASKFFDNKIN